jgi:hypothetical protein
MRDGSSRKGQDRGRGRGGSGRPPQKQEADTATTAEATGVDLSQYEIGESVYVIVERIDDQGRIDLTSIRKAE